MEVALPTTTIPTLGAAARMAAPIASKALLTRATQMLIYVMDQPARFSKRAETAGSRTRKTTMFTADTTESSVAACNNVRF